MKRKAIMSVTALIAIGLTLLIYNVAVTEWTSSLTLSAVVVCASELAILCTLGLLPEVNSKNGSTGIMIQVFAMLLIIWSLIGPQLEKESYFHIGLLAISLVMLGLIGTTAFGSHETDELNKQTESVLERKREFVSLKPTAATGGENLASMWLAMQTAIEDDELRKKVRVLVERIQAMPASRFPNATIEQGMREISAMSRVLDNPEAKERVQERMERKIKELNNYIKVL